MIQLYFCTLQRPILFLIKTKRSKSVFVQSGTKVMLFYNGVQVYTIHLHPGSEASWLEVMTRSWDRVC